MPGHDIIVVGGSAGGVEALTTLARGLPADIPAAIFMVLHVPAHARSALPELLTRAGQLPAMHAVDGQRFERGHIYVAPPDYHMLVANGHIHLVQGPKENRVRPAIDPLFRTAARFYGPRVIGVVLTGLLDDGTAGLLAVKHRGGIAVVQDPHEAAFADMPESARTYVDVDYTLSILEMATLLNELAHAESGILESDAMDKSIDPESGTLDINFDAMEEAKKLGPTIPLSCPDCSGVLFSFYEGDLLRFRCQVGHAFSPKSLLSGHTDRVDRMLWDGFNMLDEQVTLLRELERHAKQIGSFSDAHKFKGERQLLEERKEQMRLLLLAPKTLPDNTSPSEIPSPDRA